MVKHIKTGKITPNANNRVTIEVPDGYTIIIVKPDDKNAEMPMRHTIVYKPPKEDTGTIYGRIADSELSYNSNNGDSDTGTEGFIIRK